MENFLKNIKLDGKYIIRFTSKEFDCDCEFHSDSVESIIHQDNMLYFYPSNGAEEPQFFCVSEEDFEDFSRVVEKSPMFVNCGPDYIFSVENVVGFDKGSTNKSISVDCRNRLYDVNLRKKSDSDNLVNAVRTKWINSLKDIGYYKESTLGE